MTKLGSKYKSASFDMTIAVIIAETEAGGKQEASHDYTARMSSFNVERVTRITMRSSPTWHGIGGMGWFPERLRP
jgi:hypothetical protein